MILAIFVITIISIAVPYFILRPLDEGDMAVIIGIAFVMGFIMFMTYVCMFHEMKHQKKMNVIYMKIAKNEELTIKDKYKLLKEDRKSKQTRTSSHVYPLILPMRY